MKVISKTNEKRIKNSLNRICNNCNEKLRGTIENSKLLITDDANVEDIYSDEYQIFKKAYSESFGAIKGSITHEEEKYHLIVLNLTKIDELGLTDNEFDGVFSHELGHIFNENPKKDMPSVLKRNTLSEIENAKKTEQKEEETYADYFSKLTNCHDGLIGSINKYLSYDECKNTELFQERLEQLKKEEILRGGEKPIH